MRAKDKGIVTISGNRRDDVGGEPGAADSGAPGHGAGLRAVREGTGKRLGSPDTDPGGTGSVRPEAQEEDEQPGVDESARSGREDHEAQRRGQKTGLSLSLLGEAVRFSFPGRLRYLDGESGRPTGDDLRRLGRPLSVVRHRCAARNKSSAETRKDCWWS